MKKYQKHSLSAFQLTKSTQSGGSEKIKQLRKVGNELELMKNVRCFLDSNDNYASNLVNFKVKSLYTNDLFESQRDL